MWGFAMETHAETVLHGLLLLLIAAVAVSLWIVRSRQKVIGGSTNGCAPQGSAAQQQGSPDAVLPTASETMNLIRLRRSIYPKARETATLTSWERHNVGASSRHFHGLTMLMLNMHAGHEWWASVGWGGAADSGGSKLGTDAWEDGALALCCAGQSW
jgi:hypothetical protein